MFGASIGRGAQRIIDAQVRWLAHGHINPNILTVIGVALNVGCGLLFGLGRFFSAGIVLIIANLFDIVLWATTGLRGAVMVGLLMGLLHEESPAPALEGQPTKGQSSSPLQSTPVLEGQG